MSAPLARILFVDDEPAYRRRFRSALREDEGLLIETAENGEEALEKLETFPADIVITDMRMPKMGGYDLLTAVRERYPEIFVLILTGIDSTVEAVQAMKAGAYDYLLKPLDFAMVRRIITKIGQHKAVFQACVPPEGERRQGYRFENIIGQDQKMFEIYEMISQVAQTRSTAMITGESGTGKELISEAIHARSARVGKPFLQVNCAALSESLINSELFGHERGAFTGAVAQKKGLFELASGGTLFLDEIGDIPMQTQVALLRVLEQGTFTRVGGSATVRVDVRLICATNRDLIHAIREKLFREDLYYRLNVVSIHAPSLRERRSDIPLLANYFLEKYRVEAERKVSAISREAMHLLTRYPWPGNVRELANVIERAVVFCRGKELLPEHLPEELKLCSAPLAPVTLTLKSTSLSDAEVTLIRQVLEEKGWNLKQTAEALDIARGTLYSKMEKYGLHKPE
ncbi:MAG: sigma-54-dependent Fis family transcriptional regulator [Desulfuromonadales bacterium]|nr:sigma-54-dependent Fis family transcriptional regulator [Desulfuromonadales bacterium]